MAAAQAIAVNQAGNGGGSHQVIEEVRSQILNNNNYCLRTSVQALVTHKYEWTAKDDQTFKDSICKVKRDQDKQKKMK